MAQEPARLAADGRLLVDGKPFIMLAGEIHNSASSSRSWLEATWETLASMHMNTVLAPVSWEQLEPEEGVFDDECIDRLIATAEHYDMRLVILWFGTWKNGQSSYAPLWVKTDTGRFFRTRLVDGTLTDTISPFCEAALEADTRAFVHLMNYIRERDTRRLVTMIQVQNEIGAFQDLDYGEAGMKAFNGQVPSQLTAWLNRHKETLYPALAEHWTGIMNGTWTEVFGDSKEARQFCMSWAFASYVNHLASSGKAIHRLPMFVNAWLTDDGHRLAGFPNGGPVHKVIDIYKAAAPAIDLCCPDIYDPDFKQYCQLYHRADNFLLIPETVRDAAPAFYALAEHDAICFSPFAIEDAYDDDFFVGSYGVLEELMPLIAQYQGTGLMRGFLKQGEETHEELILGKYVFEINYIKEEKKGFGLIIKTDDDAFIIAGFGATVHVKSLEEGLIARFTHVNDGHLEKGEWKADGLLNGDQTDHNRVLYLRGRMIYPSHAGIPAPSPNVAVSEKALQKVLGRKRIPGIYKAWVYTYPKK